MARAYSLDLRETGCRFGRTGTFLPRRGRAIRGQRRQHIGPLAAHWLGRRSASLTRPLRPLHNDARKVQSIGGQPLLFR